MIKIAARRSAENPSSGMARVVKNATNRATGRDPKKRAKTAHDREQD